MNDSIKLVNVRVNYPFVFEKSSFDGNEPKYRATLVITKGSEADKLIQKTIDDRGFGKHGQKWAALKKSIIGNNMKYVYQDGEIKGYGENTMYLSTASAKVQPTVFHKNGVRATKDNDPIYSGCVVDAVVSIYATSQGGIAAGLMGLRFKEDGESFGGGRAATAEDFGIEEVTDVDPLGA